MTVMKLNTPSSEEERNLHCTAYRTLVVVRPSAGKVTITSSRKSGSTDPGQCVNGSDTTTKENICLQYFSLKGFSRLRTWDRSRNIVPDVRIEYRQQAQVCGSGRGTGMTWGLGTHDPCNRRLWQLT